MPNPVVHFEVVGKDMKLLETFYKDVFAWQITPVMSEYSMVGKEDGGIAGGIGAFADTPSYITFYVEVADIHAALASVESHGGKKLFPPHSIPDDTALISNFTDPEGHIVGLIQRTPKS
jgi:predicted enzyme related to lactoylglutathione lyase